jgi:hypothetical protein
MREGSDLGCNRTMTVAGVLGAMMSGEQHTLDSICAVTHNSPGWEVEYTDEFGRWWATLDPRVQVSVDVAVRLLEVRGPTLSFPFSSGIAGSRHGNLRELRVQHRGSPLRVFYAFDPRRSAILLIGGSKKGDGRFYERMIPIADRLYDEHLESLRREADDHG